MPATSTHRTAFRVGEWLVEPELDRISRNKESQVLRPQVMELLVHLATHRDRVVSLDELHTDLWAGKVVSSGTVYNCVAELRHALADGEDVSAYLETLPKKGYRLVAPVRAADDAARPAARRRKVAGLSVLAVAGIAALSWWLLDARNGQPVAPPAAADAKSIAVLPFSDMSAAEQDTAAFVFGLHNDLLTMLSQVSDLSVITRGSVEQFDDAGMDLRKIGAALGVSKVLTGSVQRADDNARVNVRLLDVDTGKQLWAGQYDREISVANIFAMQSDIVQNISTELRALLTVDEQSRLAHLPTASYAAYEAMQLGQLRMSEARVSSIRSAIAYFQEAIDRDPEFAHAYVELADSYMLLNDFGDMPPDEAFEKMQVASRKAVELDPLLGEAHTALGNTLLMADYSDPQAETAYRRAVELNPGYVRARHMYGQYLRLNSRFDESIEQHAIAVKLDPLGPVAHMGLGQVLGVVGRNDEALHHINKAIEIEPDFVAAHQQLKVLYGLNLGRLDLAMVHARIAASLDPDSSVNAESLASFHMDLGETDLAVEWARRAARIDPGLRTMPLVFQDDREAILEEVQRQLNGEISTDEPYDRMLHHWTSARYLMDAGRFADARTLLERTEPGWFGESLPDIYWDNDWDASTLAFILQRTGDKEKAALLFDRILAWQKGARRTGIHGFHFNDARILAVLGRKQEALQALQRAFDEGQRRGYWEIRIGLVPWFESIRDDPEFERITAAFEDDFAAQRARLRELE